jgi:hypothetical protein
VRGDENYRANFPPWARKPFDAFAESELARTTSWGLIADWYRALLPNEMNANREACLTRRSKSRLPRNRMTSGAGKTRRR